MDRNPWLWAFAALTAQSVQASGDPNYEAVVRGLFPFVYRSLERKTPAQLAQELGITEEAVNLYGLAVFDVIRQFDNGNFHNFMAPHIQDNGDLELIRPAAPGVPERTVVLRNIPMATRMRQLSLGE